MKYYVTGFLFSKNKEKVALIEKLNPAWQKGYFNGLGGKIEANETAVSAMRREFIEEAGVDVPESAWCNFAYLERPGHYQLHLFAAYSDKVFNVRSLEAEHVEVFDVKQLPSKLIPNLRWLIPMALDSQLDFAQPIQLIEQGFERVTAE